LAIGTSKIDVGGKWVLKANKKECRPVVSVLFSVFFLVLEQLTMAALWREREKRGGLQKIKNSAQGVAGITTI
jgi:hypothetical protein